MENCDNISKKKNKKLHRKHEAYVMRLVLIKAKTPFWSLHFEVMVNLLHIF